MKQHRRLFLLFAIALLASALTESVQATTDIELKERVESGSPVIRLGDIAKISSADRRRVRQLSVLILMPAPAPGTDRFLRRREVEDLLAAHGEDLSQLRIDGAAQIQVTKPATDSQQESKPPAAASRTDQAMNRHAAILAKYAGGGPQPATQATHDVRAEIQSIIQRHLEAKTGHTGAWQVECNIGAREMALLDAAILPSSCEGGREPYSGRQRFVLKVITNEGEVKVPVYAEVTAPAVPVAVAIRPIARDSVITAADFELQDAGVVPGTSARRAPITTGEQLIGMEARQAIQVGEVILSDKVQSPVLVKRGDLVSVISHGSGIRVRTTARARQDGAKGELVQVESLETRDQYDVRVTGHREVAVYAALSATRSQPAAGRLETARR